MDNLEKFITDNRKDFDEEFSADKFSNNLWSKISSELEKPTQETKVVRMVSVRKVWQMAACFATLLMVGLAAQFYYFQQQNIEQASIEKLAPELAEAENFYFLQISQTKTILKGYNLKEIGVETDLKEIENLDNAYKELRKEFYDAGDKTAIISAMIQNLQLRADLLNQKLQIIKQAEKAKKGEIAI